MDAQTFLDNFGTIAQTPGGLERLRQLIIHLAVWGRFTGLEAGDSGQPEESHGHLTLLPSGWQELELGAFCEIYQPRTITKNDMVPGGKHPVYGANGQIGHFDEYNHAESEVTIGCRGTCGAVNVIPAFSWITGNAMVVKPDPEVLSKAALALVLRDIDYSEVISGTAQPQITRTNLAPTVVPIPPREEQHRIVAKVDELMALCDQLGTQQQTRTQTATKFRASALDALTTAETADELQTAWQRIHTNWGALSTDVESVDGLRQLILNLAVRGRLVEQEPGEEGADPLLSRMQALRDGLVDAGVINRPRHPSGVPVSDPPYELPDGWAWSRLGDISAIVGGGTPKSTEPSFWSDEPAVPWLTPADMRGQESRYASSGSRDISELGLEKSSAQLLPKGSVLFSSRAPIGHVAIASRPLATNQGFKSSVQYEPEMSEYICVFLRKVGPEIDENATGTTFKEVNAKEVSLIPVPVPPLAEQHRIVAKVDELMALCDELESRLVERDRLGEALAASVVDAFAA